MATFYAKYPVTSATPAGTSTVQGLGTAGAQTGGVLTIQGDPAGTAIPVSGSITATNPSIGATGAAVPASATYVGGLNGGNLVGLVADSSSRLIQVGAGTAGTPAGGVLTIQGVTSMTAVKVDGSAVTQPVSAASLPLPAGAATAAKQPALGTAGTASADVLTVQGIASMTALKVDGSAVTQPVSAASLPLPSGASTAAKQPALGTAGTASADVLTVQGIASMTALKVDGSGSTQPISGTVAATQSGTWTVQPGNTANTTAWKVDGSAVTQPVSGTVSAAQSGTWTVQPGNTPNTTAWLVVQSKTKANAPVTVDYTSGGGVTTAAYTQLVASTTSALTRLYIQDTSGSFMIIAIGAAASEVDQFYYGPGFASFIDIAIPASTRISIKALDTNATTGRVIVDFFT